MDLTRFMTELPGEYFAWSSLCAYPRDSKQYVEVLDAVDHMTTPSTMHLLNKAVRHLDGDECYLEVGTWRGSTLIGALLGNEDRHGYAIDDSSMTGFDEDGRASRDVWRENMEKWGLTSQTTYIDGCVPSIFQSISLPPVGVYLFDGDKKTTGDAYEGLVGVVPFLAPHALIVVDDANTAQIREAAFWFCHQYRDRAAKILDLPTPGNCWPVFWNGLILIGWGIQLER